MTQEERRAQGYVFAVSAAGILLLFLLALDHGASLVGDAPARYWVFTAFVVLGELAPIKVPRGEREVEITTSPAFSFALVLSAGAPAAMLVQGLASMLQVVLGRKSLRDAAFGAGRYVLALTATASTLSFVSDLQRLRGSSDFTSADLPAMLSAAIVFFLLNRALSRAPRALRTKESLVKLVAQDFSFHLMTTGAMLALAPVLVVASEMSLWLVPLFAVPVAAIFRSAYVENRRLVHKLEGSVAQLVELNELNKHQALHDMLTGLPNRTLFQDRLRQAIRQGHREGGGATVMLIDLDRFKEINDTLGHQYGDLLLREVGPRLHDVLRESDTVSRLGGDEFALLLPNISAADAAVRVAAKIQSALELPFRINGMSLDVEASIGIALFPEHGDDADGLIRQADVAMYIAKEARSRIQVYEPEQDPHSPARLALVGELRRAMEDRQLDLYFQPQINLVTGALESVETLLRWEHPEHGLLTPGQFIPLAEQTGLIKPLSLYVLDAALEQCSKWHRDGMDISIAVNLPAWNFVDQRLPDDVAALLEKWDLDPRDLKLEITESTIMSDRQSGGDVLVRLSAMGVGLAIDDFGTGYSSLAYLKHLPIEEIKIDKSFVLNMDHDANDANIVRSTIDLGRNLGLRVIAEGVETQETAEHLRDLGCRIGQGFYLGRPVPPSELVATLEQRRDASGLPAEPPVSSLGSAAALG